MDTTRGVERSTAPSPEEAAVEIGIVDDEPAIGMLVAEAAEDAGYAAFVMQDPTAFLEACRVRRPRIVVADLAMPELDGIQLVKALSAFADPPALLFVSGRDARVRKAACDFAATRGLRVLGHLGKPFRLEDVTARLPSPATFGRPGELSVGRAVAAGELEVHYQPIMRLRPDRASEFVRVEALVRWRHPVRGFLEPADFLPSIEDADTWDRLTETVLETAARQVAAWEAAGLSLEVAVNLPAQLLADESLPERVAGIVDRHLADRGRVVVEVTETARFTDELSALEILSRMRIAGFKVSVDDFGIGFSSLQRLHKSPFDEVKIDRAFVGRIDEDEEALIITRAIVALAHELGLAVCAEGIETRAVLDRLAPLGCDYAQGFLFGRPAPADRITARFAPVADARAGTVPQERPHGGRADARETCR